MSARFRVTSITFGEDEQVSIVRALVRSPAYTHLVAMTDGLHLNPTETTQPGTVAVALTYADVVDVWSACNQRRHGQGTSAEIAQEVTDSLAPIYRGLIQPE